MLRNSALLIFHSTINAVQMAGHDCGITCYCHGVLYEKEMKTVLAVVFITNPNNGHSTCVATFHNMFFKWANPGLFFCLISSFQHVTIPIETKKSVDGGLGIQTRGGRMEGADESTELNTYTFDCWVDPFVHLLLHKSSMVEQTLSPLVHVLSVHLWF